MSLCVIVIPVKAGAQQGCFRVFGMELSYAIVVSFLCAPGGIRFAWEEEGIVTILSEIITEVVLPRFELLEREAVRRKLVRSSELQVRHVGSEGAGLRKVKKALPPRWLTHLR